MKLVKSCYHLMFQINYFDTPLMVHGPGWVATDSNGHVFWFEEEPIPLTDSTGYWSSSFGKVEHLGNIEFEEGEKWNETLYVVKSVDEYWKSRTVRIPK